MKSIGQLPHSHAACTVRFCHVRNRERPKAFEKARVRAKRLLTSKKVPKAKKPKAKAGAKAKAVKNPKAKAKGKKGKPKAKGTKKKPAAALAEEGEDEEDEEGEEEDPVAEEVAEEEAEEETEAAAQRAHLFAQLPPTPEKKLDPEQVKIDFKMKRSHKGDTVVVFRKGKTSDKAQPPLKPNTGMSSSSNAPPPMVTTTTTTTTTTSTPIPFESYHDSSSRYEYC